MRIKRDGYNAGGLGDPSLDWYGEPNDSANSDNEQNRPYAYVDGACVECGANDGSHYGDCQAIN